MEATAKGLPVMAGPPRGGEEKGEGEGERRRTGEGLYGRGARLKFLRTDGWKPEEPDERRACKKEKSKGKGEVSLMPPRRSRDAARRCPAVDDRQIRLGSLELSN